MKDENDQPPNISSLNNIHNQIPYCKQAYEPTKSPSYAFTAKQWREILENGKDASLSDSFREKKIERFPERFGNLLADISVLGEQDLFAEGLDEWDDWDWTPVWKQLVRTERHTRRSLSRPLASMQLSQEQMHQRAFGIELGRALQFLSRPVEDADPENILFGILLGLFFNDADPAENEINNVDETLDELKNELERWKEMHSTFVGDIDKTIINNRRSKIAIQQFLYFDGITITEPIREYIDSQVESDHSLFFDPKKRAEENKQIESTVKDLIDKNIVRAEHLGRAAEEDLAVIREAQFQKKNYWGIFCQLAESENTLGIGTINDESDVPLTQISHILDILSGQTDHERWQKRPAVQERSDGEWKVTEYGLLLYRGWLSNEEVVSWIHRYAIAPEELSKDEYNIIESVFTNSDKYPIDDTHLGQE